MRRNRAKKPGLTPCSVKEMVSATRSVPRGLLLKHFTDEEILSQIDAAVPACDKRPMEERREC